MTNDVGPLVRQWTMGSAITHLRGFVSGAHVELDEVRRFIVRVDQAGAFAAARNSRLAALSAAPRSETEQTAVAATAAAEDPAHMEIDAPEQVIDKLACVLFYYFIFVFFGVPSGTLVTITG